MLPFAVVSPRMYVPFMGMACAHWINRGISIPRVNRIFHCGVHVTVCCCCVTVQGSKLRGAEGQNAPQLTLKAPRSLSVGAKFCSLFKVRYRYAIQLFPFAPVMATFAPRFYETGQKIAPYQRSWFQSLPCMHMSFIPVNDMWIHAQV